jgi:hypothetical protein
MGACFFDFLGGSNRLLFTFHTAGAGDYDKILTDFYIIDSDYRASLRVTTQGCKFKVRHL